MTEKHRCAEIVLGLGYRGRQCSRNGIIFEGGKWWCKQHAPSAIKAKRDRQQAQWDLERKSAEHKADI